MRPATRLDNAFRHGAGEDADTLELMAAAARVSTAYPGATPPQAARSVFATAVASRRRRSSLRWLVPAGGVALIAAVILGAYSATPEQPLFEIRQVLSSIGLVDDAEETAEALYERAAGHVGIAEEAAAQVRRGAALGNARMAIVLLDRARRNLEDGDDALRARIDELERRAFRVIAAVLPARPDEPPGRSRNGGEPPGDRRPDGRDDGRGDDRGGKDGPGGDGGDDDPTVEPSPSPTPSPSESPDERVEGERPDEDGRGRRDENSRADDRGSRSDERTGDRGTGGRAEGVSSTRPDGSATG